MVESLDGPFVARFWSRLSRGGAAGAMVLALAACGGSSGDPCGLSLTCAGSGPGTGTDTGTGGTTTVAPADMTLVLNSPTVLNSGGDSVIATATVVDANRNLLANVPVTFAVDSNATAAVPSASTDANGVSKATIGVGADRSNRVITVTATSGSLKKTATIQVTGARIVATPLPATLAPGASGAVRFRLTDVNSNPIRQQDIVVTGVGAVDVKGKTDDTGTYEYLYTAPTSTGTLNVTANAGGVSFVQAVQVQASASIPRAVSTPPLEAATVSLSTGVIPANLGSTNNSVEVRALFLRETNMPAERIRVRFDLADNFNDIPGSFSTDRALIYTDVSGIARTTYTPGSRTSPNDGVTIRACWSYDDFAVGECPNETLGLLPPARVNLTVVSEPLSVSIGTNNVIEIGTTGLDYVKRFLVQVNDASGGPKADVQLSTVVDLPRFFMGTWERDGLLDWKYVPTLSCDNEDLNRNSVSELYSNGAVEDANANGQLDPRKADVVVTFEGNGRTDASGQAVLKITYPQSSASWVEANISVIASGVGGSEGRASFLSPLWVFYDHVVSKDRQTPVPTPAFVRSPYNVPYPVTPTFVSNPDWKVTDPPRLRSGMLCKK